MAKLLVPAELCILRILGPMLKPIPQVMLHIPFHRHLGLDETHTGYPYLKLLAEQYYR